MRHTNCTHGPITPAHNVDNSSFNVVIKHTIPVLPKQSPTDVKVGGFLWNKAISSGLLCLSCFNNYVHIHRHVYKTGEAPCMSYSLRHRTCTQPSTLPHQTHPTQQDLLCIAAHRATESGYWITSLCPEVRWRCNGLYVLALLPMKYSHFFPLFFFFIIKSCTNFIPSSQLLHCAGILICFFPLYPT